MINKQPKTTAATNYGFEVHATTQNDIEDFAKSIAENGLEWWEFTIYAQAYDDDATSDFGKLGDPIPVGGARVALSRDVDVSGVDWLDAFDDHTFDLSMAASDLREVLRKDPEWQSKHDNWILHLAVIDRVDIVVDFRGQGLSKLLVDAIQRMFGEALILLVPSDLDERSSIADSAAEPDGPTRTLRSKKNFQSLQKHWKSVGFRELAGKTMYLPR
jgi:hypothetical protein